MPQYHKSKQTNSTQSSQTQDFNFIDVHIEHIKFPCSCLQSILFQILIIDIEVIKIDI